MRNWTRVLMAGCGTLLIAGVGRAQEKSAAAKKALTPEAFLELRSLQDPRFSPDGTRVAFVVNEPRTGEKRQGHVWIYEKEKDSVRQLTYSAKSESSPRWAPDGKQLAFLSDRGGDEQQVYVLRMEGGEAVALTKGKASVSEFAWAPDGKTIAFLAADPKTEAEEKKEKRSEEHTSELQSLRHLVCRLLL